ncbi:ATP-binding protein [Vogesella sp. XCS3]|uniref:ATP-binding protein n=1 Tax=Vogesella sp. XCS3 TaxID=2877939 RepID=UPI001D0A4A16|nr:ATP-binding protein [Vogesella sp. XCS3]UDM18882.1 ATP-binding protein [Vogesella sp. XCS3]
MLLPFELDPQIIHHIIYSQAGSIGKAIIELLMNSVDASATAVRLTMSKDGFSCVDDGTGFASRDDVLRYFGRFGTPHQEGDATYGRFRLGRGQIMAHASTAWQSNRWQMIVNTRSMGYNYELEDLATVTPGCHITGSWYEPLTDAELMSAVQEVRDLVRYTPVRVELNGRLITRDPHAEKWDFEDEFAYYRAKEDGAVSIYNQGVLVRHDPGHFWGAGGLIVSKKAIALNVSRTEILRKTCPVWKSIAKQFGTLADAVAARLGDHRKTQARREKSARALLSGDPKIVHIYENEEVITILPGKHHITLSAFLHKSQWKHGGKITIVENGFDVPKGEAIAREGIAQVVHPQTLQRFGCYSPEDFRECLERIAHNIREDVANNGTQLWGVRALFIPELIDFATLREAFLERTRVISEKDVLDKETRRAWVALRWCIQQYAGACSGGEMYRDGRLRYNDEHKMHILLGESNTAEAWTDGKTYIAIDEKIVQRLKNEPLKTTAYIFGLVEHEVAHQGDSLDCGHDEAFYQRYHDISIRMSPERQRYIHMWLMKYTASMESEGKKASGKAWAERYLVDRAGSGRQKRGLSRVIDDVSSHPVVTSAVPEESMSFINSVNFRLVTAGLCPPPPDWSDVIEKARLVQLEMAEQHRLEMAEQHQQEAALQADQQAADDALYQEYQDELNTCRARYAALLGVEPTEISDDALNYIYHTTDSDESIRTAWAEKEWGQFYDPDYPDFHEAMEQQQADQVEDPRLRLDVALRDLVQTGETWWGLERNAAAAGFFRVEEYLQWRASEQQAN